LGVWLLTVGSVAGQLTNPADQRVAAAAPDAAFTHVDVDAAWSDVESSRRPLLLFVSMNDCKFCDKMEAETFSHPDLARSIRQLFVTAKMMKELDPELVAQLGVRAYPTTLVISPEGELIARIEGFADPKKFVATVRPALARHAQMRGRTAAREPAPQPATPAR
jgi:protein disulfide-isomerase